MPNSATDDSKGCTSWEDHNYILKGLVDELIALGARPQLKLITLQLWAKYLGKLEIAFTSKTKLLLPKFGFHQTYKDYLIIQDYIKKRKSILKQMLNAEPSSSESHDCTQDSTPTLLKSRHNMFLNVDHEVVKEELDSLRDVLKEINFRMELINTTIKEGDKDKITTDSPIDPHIKFNSRSPTMFTKIVELTDFTKQCAAAVPVEYREGLHRQLTCFDPMFLTKTKVLAILCLALFFSKDPIQFSDVMRWVRENHVSFMNQIRLFPKGIKVAKREMISLTPKHPLRYKSLQRCAFHIANMMGVEVFPAPDLAALARRFVLELQLPSVLGDYAERLMVHCRVGLCKRMMSYEAVVMAFIIVVLKTLFGLDSRTEHSISEFATEINRLMANVEEPHLGPRLFIWDDWVRYIECRKSVIITKHFPSKYRIEKDLPTAAGPYVHYCTKDQIKTHPLERNQETFTVNKQNKDRRFTGKKAVAELCTLKKIKKGYEFPPSLTPQVSYLEYIMHRNKSGTVPYADILTYDHTATSLEFLIEPNKIKQFALSQGVDVVITESPVYQNLEYIAEGRYLVLRLPTFNEVYVDIKDEVVDSPSKPQVTPWPPPKQPTKRSNNKRNINNDINHIDDEALIKMTKKKRRKKENIPTGYSNATLNNTEEGEHSSKRVQFKENTRATSSTQHNTLTLHIPSSAYWVYETLRRQPEESFEKTIEPDFSRSFRWLLNECTRILEMRTLDLYRVLRQVERLCIGDVDPTILHLTYRVRDKRWKNLNLV